MERVQTTNLNRIAVALVAAAAASAQVDRASVAGTVFDPAGVAVPAIRVEVRSASTGLTREATTGSSGLYRIPGLPAGSYTLTVERLGFASSRIDFPLSVGQKATLDVTLRLAEAATSVHVEEAPVALDRSSAEIGTVIRASELAGVPLNGRNWASFMLLAPGAVNTGEGNQNTIRYFGRSRDDNNFTLDGVDATGVKDPRQEANLRLNISLDAIAEFRVSSGLYNAESGAGAGGQMNLVSKGGTNQIHGGAFEYFRNSALDARRPIDGAKPPFRLNQFGANLGGPLRRDRAFYFANYEGLRQRLAQTFVGFVPSEAFRLRASATAALSPVMQAFRRGTARTADPNIDQINTVGSQPWQEDSGLAKADWQLGATNLSVRYNLDNGTIT
jgi:hypothetical protein